jgi:hypothetical protein
MKRNEFQDLHLKIACEVGAGRVLRGLSMTCEFRKWIMLLLFASSPTEIISQPLSSKVSELVSQSDFVGFVHANLMVSDPQSDWRQFIYLGEIDPLKGSLTRDPRTKEFPWVRADRVGNSGYPTCFAAVGEFLVFLRIDQAGGAHPWTTIAAFPVEYQPDQDGRIVGTVTISKSNDKSLEVGQVRTLLQSVAGGGMAGHEATIVLGQLLQTISPTDSAGSVCTPLSHVQRMEQARRLVSRIKQGTTRADMTKMFPEEDGGISGPGSTRYYFGSEVMVEALYDQTGGAWKPQNKVNGPIKVYRSLRHLD